MLADKPEHQKLAVVAAVLALFSLWEFTLPAEAAERCVTTNVGKGGARSGPPPINCVDRESKARTRCVTHWVIQRDGKPNSRLLTDWIGRGDRKSGRLVTECRSVE